MRPSAPEAWGEVYRARDTTLERDVAIKVLPSALAQDPERLARFKREAKALASLNHPNIAQIYGVEDRALIMELVSGKSPRGPLPIETALNYARQIAAALEAAHEKGIVHRDLKPANVIVTPEGVVKVLDFGLAAVAQPSGSESDPAASPTLTMPTQAGVIMGTAAYMSPEQAAGKPVDKRADVWSFGVVLWEFLTGRRLFDGETISHTLADVLRGAIDFDKLPRETPPAIRTLLRRCLDRNVKNRLRDIGEARVAIDAAFSGETSETVQPLLAKRSILPWAVVTGVLAVGLATAVLLWAPWRKPQPPDQPAVRLDFDLGSEVSLSSDSTVRTVIISPDGTRLVYCASLAGGPQKLFTRKLDQPKATELPGTEEAVSPFFSPNGQWVGFTANRRLNKIPVEGGTVIPLADKVGYGMSWGEDGIVFAAREPSKGIAMIPSNGGAAEDLTKPSGDEYFHGDPIVLPSGEAVLFTAVRGKPPVDLRPSIEVVSLRDRRRKALLPGASYPLYVAASKRTGYLLYVLKGTLFAVPFDLSRLETRGTAIAVLDGVSYHPVFGFSAQFDMSRTGTLVYRKAPGEPNAATVQWLDVASGKREPLLAKPGNYTSISLSPDGRRLALTAADESARSQDVWVYEPGRDAMTRLTFSKGNYDNFNPIWSADGRFIVFGSSGKGMFWTRSDGASQPQPLTHSDVNQFPSSFSSDGRQLAFTERSDNNNDQIWTVPIENSGGQLRAGKPEPFLKTQFSDQCPAFSPDGRWLAYRSNESGQDEAYVRPFPPPASGQGGKWGLSNSGGGCPVWLRSGRELGYYLLSSDQVMAVSYSVNGDSFVPEKPRVLISKLGKPKAGDQSSDGKRLALVMRVNSLEAAKPDHEVTFVFNFLDELRRRVPVGQ